MRIGIDPGQVPAALLYQLAERHLLDLGILFEAISSASAVGRAYTDVNGGAFCVLVRTDCRDGRRCNLVTGHDQALQPQWCRVLD